MYNGVGLQTARGSGTSGYVQRNLSHIIPGSKPKLQDYGQILKQLKENPNPLPKAPNQEIILHEKKRKIESQLFSMAKKLRADGASEESVKEKVAAERERLHQDLKNKNDPVLNTKDAHQAALAKQQHMEQLKHALKIKPDFESGAAFDLELQESKRLAKIAERDQRRKEEKEARKDAKRQKERDLLKAQLEAMSSAIKDDNPETKKEAAEEGQVVSEQRRGRSSSSESHRRKRSKHHKKRSSHKRRRSASSSSGKSERKHRKRRSSSSGSRDKHRSSRRRYDRDDSPKRSKRRSRSRSSRGSRSSSKH